MREWEEEEVLTELAEILDNATSSEGYLMYVNKTFGPWERGGILTTGNLMDDGPAVINKLREEGRLI